MNTTRRRSLTCRIVVHDVGDAVDQPDDQLRQVVTRRGLAAEDHRAGHDRGSTVALDALVEADDVQDVQVLALVLVDALDLDVEHRVGIHGDAGPAPDDVRESCLRRALHPLPVFAESGVLRERLERPEPAVIAGPRVADPPRRELREPRVRKHEEAPGRDAVRHIRELLRHELVEVLEHRLLQQLAVQRRDAVDRVAADAREVRHAHVALAALVDERQPLQLRVVAGETAPHLVEEAAVDLVDDLEVTRQHPAEQLDRPLLERFGQQRVVRVGEDAFRQGPRRVPVHMVLIEAEPHELGNGDGGVRVVQLRDVPVGETLDAFGTLQVDADHVLQRARHEEVLLLQPQAFACRRLVVRIQHLGQIFRIDLVLDRAVVIADVERLEVERLRRLRAPQPQEVRSC